MGRERGGGVNRRVQQGTTPRHPSSPPPACLLLIPRVFLPSGRPRAGPPAGRGPVQTLTPHRPPHHPHPRPTPPPHHRRHHRRRSPGRRTRPRQKGARLPLASLASARSGAADTGAALQAADDARLRAEVAAKRASLDAAREERAALEAAAEKARLATVDAEAGRGPPSPAARRVAELRAALATTEAALDGDATRQRLYTLLEERTR